MSDKKKLFLRVDSCGSISRSFPQKIWERLCGMAVLTRNGSLERDIHAQRRDAGWLAACLDLASCFCLVRAIKLNNVQLTWSLPMTRLGSPSARRSRACTMGLLLESSGSRAQLHREWHFRVLKKIFCHQWLACSNTLACPWWSLEGLLTAAQNWPIYYQKILVNLAPCRHSCLENNRPLACCCSCWASVEG